jgi:type IV pilus assembly protein PilW
MELNQLQVKNIIHHFVKDIDFPCKFGGYGQNYYNDTGNSLDDFFYNKYEIRIGKLPLSDSEMLPSSLESGCTTGCYKDNTNYVMVKKELGHSLLRNISSKLSPILKVKSAEFFEKNDYLLMCNKSSVSLVLASDVDSDNNSVSLVQSPSTAEFYPGDYVGKYSLEILYIRDSEDKSDDGKSIYSLYVYIKDGSARGVSYELIRGIDDFKVEYGIITNKSVSWVPVTSNVDIDVNNSIYDALKVNFMVGDEMFEKIVKL